ncbi:MAG: aminoacyl-tRNA hydrolase [Clostridia bacterium]|nr:aminoacyl-tRNA hydrolase [Clostridia bacterium]
MSNIFDLFKKIESQKATSTEPVSFIIVGLGNIGKQYELTRHNAGFLAIDYIAEKFGAKIDRVKFHATVGECSIGGARVLLMKPTTLMNNSGVAVGEAAAFYKIPPQRVLVLHDEISFDAGIIRIRRKGSAGGHNGLKSIIARLPGEDFPRIKIGIGKKPTPEYDLADWVLGKMPESDLKALRGRFDDIATASELIIKGEIDNAMAKFSK